MVSRLKPVLPFIYIPVLIIVGANFLGFVSIFLIPLLDQTSGIVLPIFRRYWFIFPPLIVFLLRCSASRYEIRRYEYRCYEIRRSSVIRWLSAFILFCISLTFLVFLCVLVYELLADLFTSLFFKKYNLGFFLLLILAILQFALRPRSLQAMTWKKLGTLWMKPPTISTITVGGFGFIATSDAIKNPLLQLTLKSEYTNLPLIVPTALFSILLMIFAVIAERIGRTKTPDDDGNIPQGWFYSAFGLAFGANIAIFGLLLDSIFLTVYTHYAIHMQTGT